MWGILDAWDPPQVKPNKKLRQNIYKEIEKFGIKKVVKKYSENKKLNPDLDLENPVRLIRIIELYESGHNSYSKNKLDNYDINSLIIGIKIDREESNKLIKQRIKKMFSMGWIEEVEKLLMSGIDPDSPAMMSIGYREIIDHIYGNSSKDQMEEKIYTSTRRLLRHQDNWFKKSDKRIKWINFENSFEAADIIIQEWLKK